jgi:hypothetical protein
LDAHFFDSIANFHFNPRSHELRSLLLADCRRTGGLRLTKLVSPDQIAYIVHMTIDDVLDVRNSDLLGFSLPGMIRLPFWRVRIEPRESGQVISWSLADSPPLPAQIATESSFVSVPGPVPAAEIRRGAEQAMERFRGRSQGKEPGLEETVAVLAAVGLGTQRRRQIPPGIPPFFGGAGVLDDFIGLADLPDEAIRAFAAHWGPLGICSPLSPWTHSLAHRSMISIEPICSPLGVVESKGRQGWEPLEKWRVYSGEAREIVLEAIALKDRRERPPDRLERLFRRVKNWMDLAAVPMAVYAENTDQPQSWPCSLYGTFKITGMFQIVALQLFGVVAGGRKLEVCTYCGLPFMLSGHREGTRRFCPTCVQRKIPMRYAARDYRRRRARDHRSAGRPGQSF